jgi:fatty-acid peroxygenase
MSTNQIPHDDSLDGSIALLKEGYLYISNRVERFQSDLFETRFLGQRVICMRGKEAAELFYDPEKFQRKGAVIKRIQETLIGKNGVQTMDGEQHLIRKHLFMSLMTIPEQKRLAELMMTHLEAAKKQWVNRNQIVLFEEAKTILCKVACQWAGVPLLDSEVKQRSEDFISMVYSFGRVGPEHWKGRKARNQTEQWIQGIIEDTRSRKIEADQEGALYKMAFYKKSDGKPFDTEMAAIELINVLRPIVAIATFITFSALALHEYSEYKEKLKQGNREDLEMFINEVRRYYPFGPFLGARVKNNFIWNHVEFKKGTLVFLDMYGTNHDSRIWDNPHHFDPNRFRNWDGDLFEFIPHGGGDPAKGHRCPGEGITVEVMKATIQFLLNHIEYEIPNQDLTYRMDVIPTLPKSGFVISNVKSSGNNCFEF